MRRNVGDIPEQFSADVADSRTVKRLHDKVVSAGLRELRTYVVPVHKQTFHATPITLYRVIFLRPSQGGRETSRP